MPINKETIISVFDEKLTLMQWLKTINKALEDAVLTDVEITKKGNATLSFKFTFEDGTYLETNDIVLQQGESINGAYIQNGHLYLTLTNSQTLDAGNVKPVSNFSIDNNQHLIVNYADGTSQDLGAIFNGNVNISGTMNATKVTGNEIVETMSGYYFQELPALENLSKEYVYASIVKNGNKLTAVIAVKLTRTGSVVGWERLGNFSIPSAIANKLYPAQIGQNLCLDNRKISAFSAAWEAVDLYGVSMKGTSNNFELQISSGINNLTLNTEYYVRYEVTFLLSDNMAE